GMSKLLRAVSGVAVAAVAGVVLLGGPASAGTVQITDGSHVFSQADVTAITNTGTTLADPVKIYTTTNLADDTAAFDDHYQQKLATSSSSVIIIGINTKSHHLA